MRYIFLQGYLDSLCGIYSIVNADKVINKTGYEESQRLFNKIIRYLADNGDLSKYIIRGIDYRVLLDILNNLPVSGIRIFDSRKKFKDVDEWWNYSQEFMSTPNRVILLSLGGREDHYTVISLMTDGAARLTDSGGIKMIRRSSCELKGYTEDDKYVIYPYQCLYLERNN